MRLLAYSLAAYVRTLSFPAYIIGRQTYFQGFRRDRWREFRPTIHPNATKYFNPRTKQHDVRRRLLMLRGIES